MSTPKIGNERLAPFGTDIEKLFGGRFALTRRFRIDDESQSASKTYMEDNFFEAFGTEDATAFGDVPIEVPAGFKFSDCALIEQRSEYPPALGFQVLTKRYETVTSTFANTEAPRKAVLATGLSGYTESQIAKPDTAFTGVVGTTTKTFDGVVHTLAGYRETERTEAFVRIELEWSEPGIISQDEDKVGSQLGITIEAFAETPATPAGGYVIARESESNVEGIPTRRFTFLKPSVLSRTISSESSGSAGAVNGGGTIGVRQEVVEVFSNAALATSSIGGVEIGRAASNVDGIPTTRITFAKGTGQIRVSKRPGPVPGTTQRTVTSLGTAVVPAGVLIEEDDIEADGHIRYVRTAIEGSITGVKYTYPDVVEVEVPGEVNCTTVTVASGPTLDPISGTVAVPVVTPKRRRRVNATVTIEIRDSAPAAVNLAFDLGQISCSVTSTSASLVRGPGATASTGNITVTGFTQRFSISANVSVFPGCRLTGAGSSEGTVAYVASSQPRRTSPSIIVTDETSSNIQTKCIGAGSTALTGYQETGIVRRVSRPMLTALDGTTYWEVITWTVA